MDVSVIIVTYNSAAHIVACLDSVLKQTGITFDVIVVDNASTDKTLAELKQVDVHVISNRQNLGFGCGNNLGFAASNGRYIYLLNPDAVMEETDALARLCRRMDENTQWGMAGTLLRSAGSGVENPPANSYPGQRHVHRDFSKLPGKIAWVVGASMIVRRELFEKLGGFDPEIFLYSEETDFCLRLRELGFEIGYVPEVAVRHIGGASEDPRDPAEVSAKKLKGLMRFRQKHYPREDCLYLARRDLRRARWRMFWNGLQARFFQPPNSKAWRKYRQYLGVWEVSRQYLASVK